MMMIKKDDDELMWLRVHESILYRHCIPNPVQFQRYKNFVIAKLISKSCRYQTFLDQFLSMTTPPATATENSSNNNYGAPNVYELWSVYIMKRERRGNKEKKKKTGDTFPEKVWLGVPESILFMINNGEQIGVSFLLRNVLYWCQYVQMI